MSIFILRICLLLLLALPARAQDAFTAALPGLAGGFSDIAASVDRLGALGDPRALPLLQALQEGKLQKTADGRLLLPDGAGFTDPATGQAAEAAGAEAVRLNNRVRQALRGALGRLQLVSPDPAQRGAAAEAIFRGRSAEDVPLLQAAIAREQIAGVRAKLELALAAAQLVAPDEAAKRVEYERFVADLAAIRALDPASAL